jgi:hypothetical protein
MSLKGRKRRLTAGLSLPVYPQLQTCRCTALTDAMCQRQTSSQFFSRARLGQLSFTSIFPIFSPLKSPTKAFGACSIPWKTV